MGQLVDGGWTNEWYDTAKTGGKFVRGESAFRNWITADGGAGPTGVGGFKAEAGRYHLVVARFEPENHVDVIVDGYRRSGARLPLVVVGSAPYAAEYSRRITELAESDDRIRLLGGVWDQELLDQLYANALTYVHGHSVGGTNPSLLRAMGAATAVIAYDVDFNREVAGPGARYFGDAHEASRQLEAAEASPESTKSSGSALQERALERYDWDGVAAGYTELAVHLISGHSSAGARGRRGGSVAATEGTGHVVEA